MLMVLLILMAMDIVAFIALPLLFACRTPRNRYPKKIFYVAAVAVLALANVCALIFRDDLFTMTLMIIVYTLLCQWLFRRGKIALLYQVIYLILLFVVQYGSAGITLILFQNISIEPVTLNCITLIIKIVLETIYTLGIIQIVNIRSISVVSRRQLIGLFLIPLVSLFCVVAMFIIGEVFYLRYGYGIFIVSTLLLLATNLYYLYLYYDVSQNQEMRRQLELNRQQNEIAYKYYETMDARIESTRKVIHDVHNHINAIEQLYASGDLAAGIAYVKDVHELLDSLGIRNFTSNHMLNMILNDKLSAAACAGIQATVHLEELKLDFIKDMDITTIFSNLLDNAIEAAGDVADGTIEVKSACFNDLLTISIKNPLSPEASAAFELYQSGNVRPGSARKGHMGVGLGNVSATVEKYHGHLSLSCKDRVFCASLLFPVKSESR